MPTPEGGAPREVPFFSTAPVKTSQLPDGEARVAMGFRLEIGVDRYSAGCSLVSWRRTGGEWPTITPLKQWRWKQRCQSTQEAVQIAYRALAEYAGEQGIELP